MIDARGFGIQMVDDATGGFRLLTADNVTSGLAIERWNELTIACYVERLDVATVPYSGGKQTCSFWTFRIKFY
jgi:hypothetical protein